MGSVSKDWHITFCNALRSSGFQSELSLGANPSLIYLNSETLIKLMDLDTEESQETSLTFQNNHALEGVQVIQLWEDVWLTRREQVLSRLQAIDGSTRRIYARKTRIVSISQVEADLFMNQNHIQCSARVKYRYGLMANETLVAVACFSGLRRMNNGAENYRSAELVRFANLLGTTVIGGLTKLLAFFVEKHQPNDIMSYADRDWSKGSAYDKSGFILTENTPPAEILVSKGSLLRTFPHRIEGPHSDDSYYKVFNLGNLKYIRSCE